MDLVPKIEEYHLSKGRWKKRRQVLRWAWVALGVIALLAGLLVMVYVLT